LVTLAPVPAASCIPEPTGEEHHESESGGKCALEQGQGIFVGQFLMTSDPLADAYQRPAPKGAVNEKQVSDTPVIPSDLLKSKLV
jgi:hypothetical protein